MGVDTEVIVEAMVADILNVGPPHAEGHTPTAEEAMQKMPRSSPLMRAAAETWRAEGRSEFYIARQSLSILTKAGRRAKKAAKAA